MFVTPWLRGDHFSIAERGKRLELEFDASLPISVRKTISQGVHLGTKGSDDLFHVGVTVLILRSVGQIADHPNGFQCLSRAVFGQPNELRAAIGSYFYLHKLGHLLRSFGHCVHPLGYMIRHG
jgi:hypothetical protein